MQGEEQEEVQGEEVSLTVISGSVSLAWTESIRLIRNSAPLLPVRSSTCGPTVAPPLSGD